MDDSITSRITVSVDTTTVRHGISYDLIGTNVVYGWARDDLWDDELAAAMRELGVELLRYPGGNTTSHFHWRDPDGHNWDDPWDPEYDSAPRDPSEYMDVDEYLAFVEKADARPMLGINLSSGYRYPDREEDALDEARTFVEYVTDSCGVDVDRWYLGNECWWDMEVEEYADRVARYGEVVRETDPGTDLQVEWRWRLDDIETLVENAGEYIDIFDTHPYWSWEGATWEHWLEEPWMIGLEQDDLTYSEGIRATRELFAELGHSDIDVGFFEWNVGPPRNIDEVDGEPRSRYQVALMNAELFLQFVDGNLSATTQWPCHRPTDWEPDDSRVMIRTLGDGNWELTPLWEMFDLYTPVLGTDCVACETSPADAHVIAAADADAVFVFVLRKAATPATVSIEFQGSGTEPNGDDIDTSTFAPPDGDVASDSVDRRSPAWNANTEGRAIEMTVPGFSLTRVRVGRD
jgi:hypothetical protein